MLPRIVILSTICSNMILQQSTILIPEDNSTGSGTDLEMEEINCKLPRVKEFSHFSLVLIHNILGVRS